MLFSTGCCAAASCQHLDHRRLVRSWTTGVCAHSSLWTTMDYLNPGGSWRNCVNLSKSGGNAIILVNHRHLWYSKKTQVGRFFRSTVAYNESTICHPELVWQRGAI